MSLVLNVEILGEFKKLTSATQGAQGSLNGLNKKASAISKSMNRAFAAIGIGLSFRVLANELQDATMAAIEDSKGQVLLADAMKKTVNATDDEIKSTEKYISSLELRTQILDDKLRPAMAIALRATGDMTKAQDLLNLAVDVSVGTGKDLEIVTKSIARAYDGNFTGLQKLVPGISKGADAMDELRAKFDGAAEAAAKTDPYKQMQVVFNDLQEKIGVALLPVLDKFSAWLSSPGGQQQLDQIVQSATEILTALGNVAMWALDNKDWLLPLAGSAVIFGGVVKAIEGITTAINAAKAAQLLFNAAAAAAPGATVTGTNTGTSTGKTVAKTVGKALTWLPILGGLAEVATSGTGPATPSITRGLSQTTLGNKAPVNVNVYTPKMTAQEITNLVNKAQRNGYTGMITMPRSQ